MMSGSGHPARVLHVYLDEPGGGPAHVGLLRAALGDAVRWDEVALDPRRLGPSPAGWIGAWRELARRIDRGAGLVHAHGVRAAAAALLPARRRVPLVITLHGLHSLRRSRGAATPAARLLNRVVLGSAERVLVLGEADRRAVLDRGLVPRDRVHRIHAAHQRRARVDRRAARRFLGLPDSADVVLWLGRLAVEKDPLTFLRTLQYLEGGDRIGLMVGDGPLLPELRARVEAAHLRGRVRFTGWLDDPAPALSASDVFVSTSRWEGLPVAALEAAAAGLPLVLSDCPGNRDLVAEGIPAVLVPPGRADLAAGELSRLLERADLRQRLGRQSIAAVARNFTTDRLRGDVLAAYREVLASKGPAGPSHRFRRAS